MIVEVIAGVVIVIALVVVCVRGFVMGKWLSPQTVLVAALGSALLLRLSRLGDVVIDRAIGESTGIYNVPDVAGHGLAFIAIFAAVRFYQQASGTDRSRRAGRIVYLLTGLGWVASIVSFVYAGAYTTPMENMVQADGMQVYSLIFTSCLLLCQSFVLRVVWQSMGKGWRDSLWWQNAMALGAVGGSLTALHRYVVLIIPQAEHWAYSPITWTFTLLSIGGYVVGVAGTTMETRRIERHKKAGMRKLKATR